MRRVFLFDLIQQIANLAVQVINGLFQLLHPGQQLLVQLLVDTPQGHGARHVRGLVVDGVAVAADEQERQQLRAELLQPLRDLVAQ